MGERERDREPHPIDGLTHSAIPPSPFSRSLAPPPPTSPILLHHPRRRADAGVRRAAQRHGLTARRARACRAVVLGRPEHAPTSRAVPCRPTGPVLRPGTALPLVPCHAWAVSCLPGIGPARKSTAESQLYPEPSMPSRVHNAAATAPPAPPRRAVRACRRRRYRPRPQKGGWVGDRCPPARTNRNHETLVG